MPQRVPISPQWRTNFCWTALSFIMLSFLSIQKLQNHRRFVNGKIRFFRNPQRFGPWKIGQRKNLPGKWNVAEKAEGGHFEDVAEVDAGGVVNPFGIGIVVPH